MRTLLVNLANALLEKETLEKEEYDAIVGIEKKPEDTDKSAPMTVHA